MKGNISLKDFITDVKTELRNAINDEDPFFFLDDVELEVSFALNASAKGSAKFVVFDLDGNVQAAQTHKVKLKLTPFVEEKVTSTASKLQLPRSQAKPQLKSRSELRQTNREQPRMKVGSSKPRGNDIYENRKSPTMKK
ncbi:trypco2 family protein [Vibrio lentus]|uniref:trypco2 family protein n=1 Tax=Vibrio lentus TaxID=136468 RepID=UPI00247A8D62|nr:trypco2 family protein [Vibrio lentus]WGS63652.1 hypothetical protein ISX51_18800 [Vibrio lentus]WGS63666.1 hypothetical protein ISX51_18875 [Vibrio lentus]